uniref:Uncharacterized protein n=1 Tax=viral metagenome TaxID=1070528 RepID=A0A6C0JU84_9ZZZZ
MSENIPVVVTTDANNDFGIVRDENNRLIWRRLLVVPFPIDEPSDNIEPMDIDE